MYPNQHTDIEIPHSSRDHVVVSDNLKIAFDLEIESSDKTRSIISNAGRALVKEKVLILGSRDIDTINNSCISDTYKDLCLSKKELEEKLI